MPSSADREPVDVFPKSHRRPPAHTGAITDVWRNGSRAWILSRCTSTTGVRIAGDRVADGDAVMRVRARVEHNAVKIGVRLLQLIDNIPP